VVYEPYAYLPVGQFVRVEEGALCGVTGIVTNHKNDSRLIISVTLLMRSVSVEIDRSFLKPIGNVLPGFGIADRNTPAITASL
jgi:hypothetical protein